MYLLGLNSIDTDRRGLAKCPKSGKDEDENQYGEWIDESLAW
jgi:hypothetical protein